MTDRNDRPGCDNRRDGRKGHKRVCSFYVEKIDTIDYRDVAKLHRFASECAKILPHRTTGTCAHHQHELAIAIRRSHHIVLLSFGSD